MASYVQWAVLRRFGTAVCLIMSSVLCSAALAQDASDGSDWSGGYWGLHAGYGSGSISTSEANGGKERIRGFVIGGHAGRNYQFVPGLIVGYEIDADYSTIDASCSLAVFDWDCELKGILSIRGRAGIVQPQFLPFVTTGLTYVVTSSDSGGSVPGFGVVVGGGVEFAQQYRPRIEALYYSLFGFGLTDADLFVVRTGVSF